MNGERDAGSLNLLPSEGDFRFVVRRATREGAEAGNENGRNCCTKNTTISDHD
jgi:hypothetical protein